MKGILKYKKILCAVIALTVFVLLAGPVSASTYVIPIGYGPVSGNTVQSGNRMVSTVKIAKNPDNAVIRIKQQFQAPGHVYPVTVGESSPGVCNYSYSRIIPNLVEYAPDSLYVTYEVYKGSTYESYAWYGAYPVS